jgi:TonB family protein
MARFVLRASLLILLTVAPACAQDAGMASAVETYAESAAGLKELAANALELARRGDHAALNELVRTMVLPDPDAWFEGAFGEAGRSMARDYRMMRAETPGRLFGAFLQFVRDKQTHIDARRLDKPCEARVTELQYPLLAARVRPVDLYEIRALRSDSTGRALWFFAWVDGGFRYIGMPVLTIQSWPMLSASGKTPRRVREGGAAQPPKLVQRVNPKYPSSAQSARMQGTVRLLTVIQTDGTPGEIRVLQGHCWLAEAAIKAVRQWRYEPARLAGEPVEVSTVIDVAFQLRR